MGLERFSDVFVFVPKGDLGQSLKIPVIRGFEWDWRDFQMFFVFVPKGGSEISSCHLSKIPTVIVIQMKECRNFRYWLGIFA